MCVGVEKGIRELRATSKLELGSGFDISKDIGRVTELVLIL